MTNIYRDIYRVTFQRMLTDRGVQFITVAPNTIISFTDTCEATVTFDRNEIIIAIYEQSVTGLTTTETIPYEGNEDTPIGPYSDTAEAIWNVLREYR